MPVSQLTDIGCIEARGFVRSFFSVHALGLNYHPSFHCTLVRGDHQSVLGSLLTIFALSFGFGVIHTYPKVRHPYLA
jgi:hypothetical protein